MAAAPKARLARAAAAASSAAGPTRRAAFEGECKRRKHRLRARADFHMSLTPTPEAGGPALNSSVTAAVAAEREEVEYPERAVGRAKRLAQ